MKYYLLSLASSNKKSVSKMEPKEDGRDLVAASADLCGEDGADLTLPLLRVP